jgi:nucleotide-binding universal stress UspA family protein
MIIWNRVLVGVDGSEHGLNAVRYLAAVLGGSSNCKVHLMAVHLPTVLDDPDKQEKTKIRDLENRLVLEQRLLEAYGILIEARLASENLSKEMVEADGHRGVGEVLMEAQSRGGYGTVVVGRRGLSKAEEFLFGSVSNTVMHQAVDCCVWVVG